MPPRPSSPSLFAPESKEAPTPAAGTATAGWLHAHCDGGARGNPGPSGYGALLEDDSGAVVAEISEFLGLRTNNFAEYSGLLGCLQYALDNNHRRLKVVSDSELMVKQIQGKYQVKSPDLKPLYDEAKRRIAKLDAFEISHALRHKNKDADRLANDAMDRGMKRPRASPAPPVAVAVKREAPPVPIAIAGRSAPRSVLPVAPSESTMLRGLTRDGVVHILGSATLPDGVFVKIIRE